jgi:hypothetical protein
MLVLQRVDHLKRLGGCPAKQEENAKRVMDREAKEDGQTLNQVLQRGLAWPQVVPAPSGVMQDIISWILQFGQCPAAYAGGAGDEYRLEIDALLPLRTLAERGDTMLADFFVMQSDV